MKLNPFSIKIFQLYSSNSILCLKKVFINTKSVFIFNSLNFIINGLTYDFKMLQSSTVFMRSIFSIIYYIFYFTICYRTQPFQKLFNIPFYFLLRKHKFLISCSQESVKFYIQFMNK